MPIGKVRKISFVSVVAALSMALLGHARNAAAGWYSLETSTEPKYVHSVEDLKAHFLAHRFRVKTLALTLIQRHPELLGGTLTPQDVADFISLHDLAKVDNSPDFKNAFWPEAATDKPSFIQRLYTLYGSNLFPNNPPKHEQAVKIIQELNEVDSNVAYDYFETHQEILKNNELSAEAKTLLRIEHIADVVDRNTDPVAQEELGVKSARPLSLFFKSKDGVVDEKSVAMAAELKKDYAQITAGLSFEELTHSIPTCIQTACSRTRTELLIAKLLVTGCDMILKLNKNTLTISPTTYPKFSTNLRGRTL